MEAKNQLESVVYVDKHISGMEKEGCIWELVPPQASYFAGVWERKLSSVKKVFSAVVICLAKNSSSSRDEFKTPP